MWIEHNKSCGKSCGVEANTLITTLHRKELMMMMMMSGFVERVILRRAIDQPNRWALRCRANVRGERVAVRRAAANLFQMTGPATAKLLIPSVRLE